MKKIKLISLLCFKNIEKGVRLILGDQPTKFSKKKNPKRKV